MRLKMPLLNCASTRSRCGLALVSLLLASHLVYAANPNGEEVVLEVLLNGVSYGASWVCIYDGARGNIDVSIDEEFFKRVSVKSTADNTTSVPCRDRSFRKPKGVIFEYDELNGRLVGRFLEGQALDTARISPAPVQAVIKSPMESVTSQLFNYTAAASHSSTGGFSTGHVESISFTDWGQLLLGRDLGEPNRALGRWSDALLRRDFFEQRLSVSAGRQSDPATGWLMSVDAGQLDGLVISKRVTDDEDRALGAPPSLQGYMPQPGTVIVRQADRVIKVLRLPAGPFIFSDPSLSPHRQVELEMHSEDGRLIDKQAVFALGGAGLLPTGKSEWKLAFGRQTLPRLGQSTRSLAASAAWRYGVSDRLSLHVLGQATARGPSTGLDIAYDLGLLGSATIEALVGRAVGERSSLVHPALEYELALDKIDFGYRIQPLSQGRANGAHTMAQSATFDAHSILGKGTISVVASWSRMPGVRLSGEYSFAASYARQLSRRVAVNAFIRKASADSASARDARPQYGLRLSFSLSALGGMVDSEARFIPGESDARTAFAKPFSNGSVWELSADSLKSAHGSSSLTWNTTASQGWVSATAGLGRPATSAFVSGAVAIADGQILPVAHNSDAASMAIIWLPTMPNVALVRQGAQDQILARTNAAGIAVLTGVEPYVDTQVSIAALDMPAGIRQPTSLVDRPLRRWAASRAEPQLRHVLGGRIRLVDTADNALAANSLVAKDVTSDTSVIAIVDDQGQIQLDDLDELPNQIDVFLAPDFGTTCHAEIPAQVKAQISQSTNIPSIRCRSTR